MLAALYATVSLFRPKFRVRGPVSFSRSGRGWKHGWKSELLLAHLRGDADFEASLAEFHRCRKAKKPKADFERVSSALSHALTNAGHEGGRAGDAEDKRKAGQSSGLARGAAARRRRGQDDAAIAATAKISRFTRHLRLRAAGVVCRLGSV